MACFSFYPGKNLGAYGEGGAVTTSNPELCSHYPHAARLGPGPQYHHVLRGYNYRMEGFQGAILGVKLRHLDEWTAARRSVVQQYNELLAGCDVETPVEMPWGTHVYHVYTLRSADRDGLQAALTAEGIQTGIHYPVPVHLQPAYADHRYKKGSLPLSEKASVEVLSLPLYPEMTDDQIHTVSQTLTSLTAAR